MEDRMDERVELLLLEGVARPCPDCAEERLFVPAEADRPHIAEYCCTWCGAGLLIDPEIAAGRTSGRQVA